MLNEEGNSNESQSSQSFAQIQTEKAIGLVEKAKICLEQSLKAHLTLQNSHIKKSKKINMRKIDGECLTEEDAYERKKEHEKTKLNKKKYKA